MKEIARPIVMLFLSCTLCILAVAQTAGMGTPPQWFLGLAIPVISGLLIERGIRKGKSV